MPTINDFPEDTRVIDLTLGQFLSALGTFLLSIDVPAKQEEYVILKDAEGKLGEPGIEYKYKINQLVKREEALFITDSDTATLTRWINEGLIKPYGAGKIPKYKVSDLLQRKAKKRMRRR